MCACSVECLGTKERDGSFIFIVCAVACITSLNNYNKHWVIKIIWKSFVCFRKPSLPLSTVKEKSKNEIKSETEVNKPKIEVKSKSEVKSKNEVKSKTEVIKQKSEINNKSKNEVNKSKNESNNKKCK